MTKINYLNMTEEEFLENKFIYKFLSMGNAFKTLDNKQLWFANPIKWKDPFEKRFLNAKYIDSGKEDSFRYKNRIACMCITQTPNSEASWKAYSENDKVIKFSINREVLLKVLKNMTSKYDIYIGKMEYMNTVDIKKPLNKIPFNPLPVDPDERDLRLLLLKRISYAYEDEIRIVLVKPDDGNSGGVQDGIALKYDSICSNTELIHRITLDPELEKNSSDYYKHLFHNRYSIKEVCQCYLYKDEPKDIKIKVKT